MAETRNHGLSERGRARRLAQREERRQANLVKGSTGEDGRDFEIVAREQYRTARGMQLKSCDYRAHSNDVRDMVAVVNGKRVEVEIKTGCGALVYDNDEARAWERFDALKNSSKWILWDVWRTGDPQEAVFIPVAKLLAALEAYNPKKGLATWFVYCKPTAKRGGQVQFQVYTSSEKKKAFLEALQFEFSSDWQTFLETGEA